MDKILTNTVSNYILEPGDATRYRLGFQYCGSKPYVLDSGIGDGSDFLWIYINMQAGSGVGTIRRSVLREWNEDPQENRHWLSYLKNHGFGEVDTYTLIASLLAIAVLQDGTAKIREAERNMLRAPEALGAWYEHS